MESITLRKSKRILDFDKKTGKRIFIFINFLLFTGIITIVSTLLYLLFNLDQSDRIILRCIPIIALGLILVLFYIIGYYKLTEKENRERAFKMQFMEKFRVK
jgi:hypothetical protein